MSYARLNTLCKIPSLSSNKSIHIARPTRVVQANQTNVLKSATGFHTTAYLKNQNENGNQPEQKPEEKKETEQKAGATNDAANKDNLIKDLEKQVEDYKAKLVYSYAERENIRRMAKEETDRVRDFGISSFAKQILDVADNLSRCLTAAPKEGFTDKNAQLLFEGLQMTEKEMVKVLEKNNITKYHPVGQKFDPHTMNALMEVPSADKEVGTVFMVFKPGFMLKERVLRPADVSVVRAQ